MFRVWKKQLVQVFKFYLYDVCEKSIKHDLSFRVCSEVIFKENYWLYFKQDRHNFIKPFCDTVFLYSLKISENLWLSDFFRGYRKRAVAWTALTNNLF